MGFRVASNCLKSQARFPGPAFIVPKRIYKLHLSLSNEMDISMSLLDNYTSTMDTCKSQSDGESPDLKGSLDVAPAGATPTTRDHDSGVAWPSSTSCFSPSFVVE